MKRRLVVVVESPYAGNIERNLLYARAAVRDSLLRGETPFASHLLYTQPGVLRDEVQAERADGMEAGWALIRRCDVMAVYEDLGISQGMQQGIAQAKRIGVRIERRSLPEWATSRSSS